MKLMIEKIPDSNALIGDLKALYEQLLRMRVEHYEIAVCGSERQLAAVQEYDQDVALPDATIHEEGRSDHRQKSISAHMNPTANKAA
jgi:ferritin-like metal-binding protein YciE